MNLQDGIQKVLTTYAENNDFKKQMQDDPDQAVRSLLGDDVSATDLKQIASNATKIAQDKETVTGVRGLLGVKSCIPGLAAILAQKGGMDMILAYIRRGMQGGSGMPLRTLGVLSELLSMEDGVAALQRLIGMDESALPDLNSMMSLLSTNSAFARKKAASGHSADAPAPVKDGQKIAGSDSDGILGAINDLFNF